MRIESLNGSWKLRQSDTDRWLDASVPGGVYTDLLNAGEIPDPYDDDNELDLQWVGTSDWVYRHTVTLDDDFLDEERVRLRCAGLDTIATVRINGTVVGEAANMHRKYEFDVGDALTPGENQVEITFHSPVEYSVRHSENHGYQVPTLRYPVDQPGRNFIRKAQCHYGWDWGPCLPTSGIWRDIDLLAYSEPRIEYTKTVQDHDGNSVSLDVTVGLDAPADGDVLLAAEVANTATHKVVDVVEGHNEVTITLDVSDPDLWWPNGYGDQPLYDLIIAVDTKPESVADDTDAVTADGGVTTAASSLLPDPAHETSTRIGFRELELVREPDGEGDGESFTFEVNGVSVFAKGANWIPADALYGRITRDRYESLLDSAIEANMNMIRVWGGGYYERDGFYEACDERGLLVWQDFMFACALYPSDDDYLASVEEEVRYQVRRLADHPSIALWCGNNEVEMGLESWFDDADELEQLKEDYETLFYDVIGDTVAEEDETRTYWPGSPSSGTGRQDPYPANKGDIHYWDVWHDGADFEEYETVEPRFVSEFGYQSFPSVDALSSVLPDNELNPTAPLMEHHQRHEEGNRTILQRMAALFRIPFSFADFVYLSQVQQGLAMKVAIEHWRRLKPDCMGTLYWQLNDLWPCASWSSIEYGGDWKALQHVSRRIYAPVLLSTTMTDDGDEVEIWLTNDERDHLKGNVAVEAYTFDGERIDGTDERVSVAALDSARVATVNADRLLGDIPREEAFLRVTFDGSDETYPAFTFFEEYKHLELPEPNFDVAVDRNEVTIKADAAALFVELNVPLDGQFSDNYFHLTPGEEQRVAFNAADPPDDLERRLTEELSLNHLRATY
ncbi:glycoside hydrolase family 2 sugar binding protein (plasmid) [Haloterrigena turkmenica DSM 5511]|uniref:Beta-mannosidase B n=1 Tax=Haloterrigena turkmenica (strain ATCC 51198 / DSM 5511 / JCM 9101 / NCIMB 13204 / VKM B-1734 / 4k) TaxID=543526 RepID=D2S257_HALTV|nr:glycoside hydrolase family 2 protein [Haloterrigena turkmenica]ADB63454.1 glycoside hydrolase family 2 sugar binding protein [Haloterrigena turkmenica DSM 5511]